MRKPLSPLQAFAADAQGATTRGVPLDHQLLPWLSIAQAADALSSAPRWRLRQDLPHIESLLPEYRGRRPTLTHDAQPAPTESLDQLYERFRSAAEDMELAGCFELAFTTVSAVCRLAIDSGYAALALATVHLGRVARQMNDYDSAEQCYESAVERTIHERDGPLAARGYIGQALIHDMRGNRPAAERLYRKALRAAVFGGGAYVHACQGLMTLSISDNRLADALLFGWKLYDASEQDTETRASALTDLSVVALRAGFFEPAKLGFAQVINMRPAPRALLLALGGAVRAAARLDNTDDVRQLGQAIDTEIARANQPHDAAQVLMYLAEAHWHIGERVAARGALERARVLATTYRYHEYEFRVDAMERDWAASPTLQPSFDEAPVPFSRPSASMRTSIARLTALR